jgi:hypothetical protein
VTIVKIRALLALVTLAAFVAKFHVMIGHMDGH